MNFVIIVDTMASITNINNLKTKKVFYMKVNWPSIWKVRSQPIWKWKGSSVKSEKLNNLKVMISLDLPWSSIWKWGVHHYVSGVCQSAIARSSECTFVTVQRSSIWKCWLSKSYSKIINKKVKRVFLWNQGDHQYESAAEFGGARYGFVRKAWLSGISALIAFNVMFPEMSEIGFNCNICWWIFQILGTTWLWMSMTLALNVN